jgi:protein phosphatase
MIERLFLLPGETALLARRRPGSAWAGTADRAERFLDALSKFSAPGPLEVRPFHVLARANLSSRGTPTRDLRLGFHVSHHEQLALIEALSSGVVQPCSWHGVDLGSRGSTDRSVDLWMEHCANAGEGFVYKPAERGSLRGPDGYLRQPALKVRGRDYLRLIYGIDYLEASWFARLRARDTRRKRVLAVQEQELAERLLLAFLHQSEAARLSYLAAFLGVDGVRMPEVDRTL